MLVSLIPGVLTLVSCGAEQGQPSPEPEARTVADAGMPDYRVRQVVDIAAVPEDHVAQMSGVEAAVDSPSAIDRRALGLTPMDEVANDTEAPMLDDGR